MIHFLKRFPRITKSYLFLFLSFLSVWILVHFIQIFIKLPLVITNYFDDLLVLPICLSLSAFLQCLLIKAEFKFSFLLIILSSIYFGITFEIIIPKYHSAYTADPVDFVMYLLGALLFYVLQANLKTHHIKNYGA